jgi:hypothetical protein
MRYQTADTARTARTQHPDTADVALPPVTPRSQNTSARTDQITDAKTSFYLDRVDTCHDHGCLHQHQGTALPSGQGNGEGRRFPERDQTVVAHQQGATRRQPL